MVCFLTLIDNQSIQERERVNIISSISNFRPTESIFELGKKGKTNPEAMLMQKRRITLGKSIIKNDLFKKSRIEMEIVNQKTLGAAAINRDDINNFVLNQNDEMMSSNLIRVFIEKILPYVGKKYGPLIIEAVIDAITKAIDEEKL